CKSKGGERSGFFAETVGDRIAPIPPERARRDARARRRLAALVFVDSDKPHHLLDRGLGKARGNDLGGRLVAFHVAFHDAVEDIVRRQAVLVGLVGAQFGRRGPRDDAARYDFAVAIAPFGKPVHQGLGTSLITAYPPAMSPYKVQ